MFSSGSLPSCKLQHLPASYPFTQQVDVIFPSVPESGATSSLEAILSTLRTRYVKVKVRLSDVFEQARRLVDVDQNLVVISTPSAEAEDAWCIDHRGLLSIHVSKETYERLGLVGVPSPSLSTITKNTRGSKHDGTMLVQIPLRGVDASLHRHQTALREWDARREAEGVGAWNVVYHCTSTEFSTDQKTSCEVQCQVRHADDIYIPQNVATIISRHDPPEDGDTDDGYSKADIAELLEWIGMAGLGAQRLQANDRVNPYIAVYEPPVGSTTGKLTHIRWRGLLSPDFVQSVICTTMSQMSSSPPPSPPWFVAITSHPFLGCPVSYIPTSHMEPGETPRKMSTTEHVGGPWCLILASDDEKHQGQEGTWMKISHT